MGYGAHSTPVHRRHGSSHDVRGRRWQQTSATWWSAAEEVLVVAPEFSRSRVLVQYGFGIDRQTIVTRVIGDGSHPRLGLALSLPEAQG
jgi:hypothetical protein